MANTHSKNFAYITDLHYEHRLWINELKFYKEELVILQERLGEIVAKNTNNEVEAGVESFQNRFDLQRDHISELKHRIKMVGDLALIAINHENERIGARLNGLLSRKLNQRFIDDRQHFFRACLRGW